MPNSISTMLLPALGLLSIVPAVLAGNDPFAAQRSCALGCWGTGDVSVWSGCSGNTLQDLTACWCKLQPQSIQYLTTCITAQCDGDSAADVKTAVNLYKGFCGQQNIATATASVLPYGALTTTTYVTAGQTMTSTFTIFPSTTADTDITEPSTVIVNALSTSTDSITTTPTTAMASSVPMSAPSAAQTTMITSTATTATAGAATAATVAKSATTATTATTTATRSSASTSVSPTPTKNAGDRKAVGSALGLSLVVLGALVCYT